MGNDMRDRRDYQVALVRHPMNITVGSSGGSKQQTDICMFIAFSQTFVGFP